MMVMYKTVNYMKAKNWSMLADSMLNAMLAICENISWDDAVNLLYARSINLACRPYDLQVINSIFKDVGLTKNNKIKNYSAIKETIGNAGVAFVQYGSGYTNGKMSSCITEGENLTIMCHQDVRKYAITSVWTGNKTDVSSTFKSLVENADNDTCDYNERKTAAYRPPDEHKYFHYFQPNPKSKNIGDCVVRAFSAVLDEPWESVMKQLSDSLGRNCIDFNYDMNFLNLLLAKGFGRHPFPTSATGKSMTGVELCEWLKREWPEGNCKAFAYVGRSHVAAVLPYKDDSGETRYRFHDSWDSSGHKITDLYILEIKNEEDAEPIREALSDIEVGQEILHPQFGKGCVSNIVTFKDNAIVSVTFGGEEKKMMRDWMLTNCCVP